MNKKDSKTSTSTSVSPKILEKKLKANEDQLHALQAFIAVELGHMKSQIEQLENVVVTVLRLAEFDEEDTNELVTELLDVERNKHYRDIIQLKINDKVNPGR